MSLEAPVPDEQLILAFTKVVNMFLSMSSARSEEPVSFCDVYVHTCSVNCILH